MATVLYYDDQKRPIATSDAELLIYFKSISGTVSAANVPYLLDCPMNAVFRIQSSGKLPKFIYKYNTNPSNRIYLKQISGNTLNLDSLCTGVNTGSLVPKPTLGLIQGHKVIVPIPVLGLIQGRNYASETLALLSSHGSGGTWAPTATASAFINNNIVTLNIGVFNTFFNSAGAKDVFTNEPICIIDGPNAIPNSPVTILSSINPNLPLNSSIVIQKLTATTTVILYSGEPVTENAITGSVIEFYMVKYDVNN